LKIEHQRQRGDHHTDDAVQPVVISGHDDDDHRDHRMRERDPAPAPRRSDHDRHADDRRPRDMNRRHRRKLRRA
jgi:hypothetical protein